MMKTLQEKITTVTENPLISFYFGTMRSGKTEKLLNDSLDYDQSTVFVLPEEDTGGIIESRAFPVSDDCKYNFVITPDIIFGDKQHLEDSAKLFDLICENEYDVGKVVIDEAQFLNPGDVHDIAEACRLHNTRLDSYGLLTDFHGDMFEGSREWINQADESICIEGHCEFPGCLKKSYYNCLMKQKKSPDSNVVVGDSQYIVLCPEHRELYKEEGLIEE